jgi:hypothetical protein
MTGADAGVVVVLAHDGRLLLESLRAIIGAA